MENIHFSGRMSEIDFLKRLYSLEELPSYDQRYKNALEDIWQHTQNNCDYEGNWVFDDVRFKLKEGTDAQFLNFLCEMLHPLVRPDKNEVKEILSISNDWLGVDGYELFPENKVVNGNIYKFGPIVGNSKAIPSEDELSTIWEPSKLRFFISHRDIKKSGAKELGVELKKYGLSCFVAHDSIQAMSTWKHEIMKALQTMDAFVCYITEDFYASEWTNQEVGYALARGVPIYLYSVDKTDPKGFKSDTQAIKTGFKQLLNCIKKDFSSNSTFKKFFIDEEIEEIISNIVAESGKKTPKHVN